MLGCFWSRFLPSRTVRMPNFVVVYDICVTVAPRPQLKSVSYCAVWCTNIARGSPFLKGLRSVDDRWKVAKRNYCEPPFTDGTRSKVTQEVHTRAINWPRSPESLSSALATKSSFLIKRMMFVNGTEGHQNNFICAWRHDLHPGIQRRMTIAVTVLPEAITKLWFSQPKKQETLHGIST